MVGRLDINKAEISNYSSQDAYEVPLQDTDGVTGQSETEYSNPNWTKYFGYFNNVGDLKQALLMKAVWAVGKGYTADPRTTSYLESFKGWGKDTFDDILFNAYLISLINGDSYTQIIRDPETLEVINLKPLNAGNMTTIVSRDGRIKRYEQRSSSNKKVIKKFQPEDIFHLINNRVADQVHGISDIDALEKTILAEEESFDDMQKLQHFQVKPFIIFKLKTDDTAKIAEFVGRVEDCRRLGEDMFLPDDDNIASWEIVQVNPSSVIMEWRNSLKNKFFRQVGMPEILFGTSGATESGGKMEMFAHDTIFEHNQRYLEKQLWAQLGIKIDLIAPSSIAQNLQTDQAKDAQQGAEIQPNDVTAGVGE